MTIELASWASLGYRKVGPLPASGSGASANQVVQRLTMLPDYQTKPDHWVRRHARQKGAHFHNRIQVAATVDKDHVNDDSLAFVDDYLKSRWLDFEGSPRFRANSEDELVKVVQAAETSDERWRGMYRIAQALVVAGPQRLRPLLRDHVLPCFFRLYPEGKLVVLKYDLGFDEMAAVLRVMYAMSQTPLPELQGAGAFRGVLTLQRWHMTSLTRLVRALFSVFNNLFYPFIGGGPGNFAGTGDAVLATAFGRTRTGKLSPKLAGVS